MRRRDCLMAFNNDCAAYAWQFYLAGRIAVGDKVLLERAQAKDKRLHENSLMHVADQWINASKELGLNMEKQDEEKMKARKSVRLKKF